MDNLPTVSQNARKVMAAFANSAYTLRGVGSLADDTSLDRVAVQKAINELIFHGFIEQTTKDNQPLFFMTSNGRKYSYHQEQKGSADLSKALLSLFGSNPK